MVISWAILNLGARLFCAYSNALKQKIGTKCDSSQSTVVFVFLHRDIIYLSYTKTAFPFNLRLTQRQLC